MSDTINNIADHAARQDDRWVMMALLVVLLIVGIVIWRWMTADREKISQRLTEVTDRHIKVTEQVVEVVATNTAVLHEVRKKL